MGSTEENVNFWSAYEWPEGGDEWSTAWGGTPYLWWGTIFPRITAFVPCESILEIAPGYGRCTHYLAQLCRNLAVVDIAENCIQACRNRFSRHSHVQCFVNDGRSLDMIPDDSLNFVFSWDSLVHAESDVIEAYLGTLASKLKTGGVGFFHHSNIGAFKDPGTGQLTIENPMWRATSMTAELFRGFCGKAGLNCVTQEIIGWGGQQLIDAFSVFSRPANEMKTETTIYENAEFMREAINLQRIAGQYRL